MKNVLMPVVIAIGLYCLWSILKLIEHLVYVYAHITINHFDGFISQKFSSNNICRLTELLKRRLGAVETLLSVLIRDDVKNDTDFLSYPEVQEILKIYDKSVDYNDIYDPEKTIDQVNSELNTRGIYNCLELFNKYADVDITENSGKTMDSMMKLFNKYPSEVMTEYFALMLLIENSRSVILNNINAPIYKDAFEKAEKLNDQLKEVRNSNKFLIHKIVIYVKLIRSTFKVLKDTTNRINRLITSNLHMNSIEEKLMMFYAFADKDSDLKRFLKIEGSSNGSLI